MRLMARGQSVSPIHKAQPIQANVLERVVPAAETVGKGGPDGTIASRMIRRAKGLRAAQSRPFPEDSADLIREAREQRHAEV
jgi:hypothetical protein